MDHPEITALRTLCITPLRIEFPSAERESLETQGAAHYNCLNVRGKYDGINHYSQGTDHGSR